MYRVLPAIAATLVLLALPAALPAVAQDGGDMPAHFGRQIYRLLCAGCHGADGRGDADVGEALGMPIPDLTTISRRNGGVFPADEMADAIAGLGTRGHRRLAIEPWPEVFADDFARFAEKVVVDELVARRIQHLLAYLESIQR